MQCIFIHYCLLWNFTPSTLLLFVPHHTWSRWTACQANTEINKRQRWAWIIQDTIFFWETNSLFVLFLIQVHAKKWFGPGQSQQQLCLIRCQLEKSGIIHDRVGRVKSIAFAKHVPSRQGGQVIWKPIGKKVVACLLSSSATAALTAIFSPISCTP